GLRVARNVRGQIDVAAHLVAYALHVGVEPLRGCRGALCPGSLRVELALRLRLHRIGLAGLPFARFRDTLLLALVSLAFLGELLLGLALVRFALVRFALLREALVRLSLLGEALVRFPFLRFALLRRALLLCDALGVDA